MRRGTWATHPLLTAPGHPEVVRAADLEEIGVPRRTISRRCGAGGPWQSLLPGIVLTNNGEPSDEHRGRAALLHGRAGAVLTGTYALRCHGLDRLPGKDVVHVLIPASRDVADVGFVRVERTNRLPRPHLKAGLPMAPVPRAVADTVRRLTNVDEAQAVMAEAVQRRFCTPEMLADELDRGRTAGTAMPRRALAPLLAGARSVAEADAWRLWRRSGLPPGRWNVPIHDAQGGYIATPDFWCDEIALAWEIDSFLHHTSLDDHRATVARNARYVAAGIVVLQTLPSRLRTEPDKVVAELRAACRTAQARPRPHVLAA
ncbi:endonuclease domain-containing protein [Amycolatopsis sp. MJM2582]|uniref:endonuclease domain-containing protein n=1 Tax=Amycolatopsis sp. MJM2582 TaxID=1427749 RepID=UPI001F225282|nr:endonuclease domain-containing protein [Amycolatopsis sp. MJM2582]